MQSRCEARASTSNMEIQTVSAPPTFIFSADALVKLGIIYIQLSGYSSITSKSEEPLIKVQSSSMVHKG